MTPEYSFYHGALLRELILQSGKQLTVALSDIFGRPNTYLLNGHVGVVIKHSTKRLTPWQFTFTQEHYAEIEALQKLGKNAYICFVCGEDGFACISIGEFFDICSAVGAGQGWVRIERKSGQMYGVSGSVGLLKHKVARGVGAVANLLTTSTNKLEKN
jgi:hypothetical protein